MSTSSKSDVHMPRGVRIPGLTRLVQASADVSGSSVRFRLSRESGLV